MIFGQGFLPLALDNSISNCWAAVLVLVHTGYFISPVPTIFGERSPIRHLRRRPMGEGSKIQRKFIRVYLVFVILALRSKFAYQKRNTICIWYMMSLKLPLTR